MKILKSVKRTVDKILDWSMVIILASMSLVVAANVFSRFVLNSSIYWGDEMAMVLFVWLTFLGAAIGIREKTHYTFKYFNSKLSGKNRQYYQLIGDTITLVAILILLFYSMQVTGQISKWIMPALEISRTLVYGAVPVGCLFMIYYLVLRVKRSNYLTKNQTPNS